MCDRIEWDDRATHHIRTRSQRYPDAVDIEPESRWSPYVIDTVCCMERVHGAAPGGQGVSIWRDEMMSDPHVDVTPEVLQDYRAEAEATRDEALSPGAARPSRGRVLSVRLNEEEFEELGRCADQLELPASTLVRGWILSRLRADADTSAVASVDRIAREIEQLRRRLVS